jgi:hypothetical protein
MPIEQMNICYNKRMVENNGKTKEMTINARNDGQMGR